MKPIVYSLIILLFSFNQHSTLRTTWQLDKQSSTLNFSIDRVILSPIKGSVKSFDVQLSSTENDFNNAIVGMTATVSSMTTGNNKRDTELKSRNFFDAAKYPEIKFVSNSFRKNSETKYVATGDLTMHGITKPVTLDIIYLKQKNETGAAFRVTCKLNRFDFNIGSGTDSRLVSKDVIITAEVSFKKTIKEVR